MQVTSVMEVVTQKVHNSQHMMCTNLLRTCLSEWFRAWWISNKWILPSIFHLIYRLTLSIVGNLTISPRYGPMLGGQYVVISGPCIDNETEIKASFSGFPEQKCYRKSEFSMSCVTPIFNRTGDITVTVEIENNQGENSVFRGIYTIRT